MEITEILYIVLIVSVAVITITIVWLANELMQLIKSLRRSANDTALMTNELKDKVLLVSEALDRAGTAATKIIGMIEDGIETIREKKDQISNSIGLVAGVGDYYKQRKQAKVEEKEAKEALEDEPEKDTEDEKSAAETNDKEEKPKKE